MAEDPDAARLRTLIRSSPWVMDVLRAARACDLPDWLVGAGILRNLVWDEMHGGFDPANLRDVDVAFFDPGDLSTACEKEAESALRFRLPDVPWDAKNEAAVHLWYERRFGVPVAPLTSSADAVGTWPETATAVAVRLYAAGELQVVAPCGLGDLFRGICRRNPRRVTVEEYRLRLQRKRVAQRWPEVRIVDA